MPFFGKRVFTGETNQDEVLGVALTQDWVLLRRGGAVCGEAGAQPAPGTAGHPRAHQAGKVLPWSWPRDTLIVDSGPKRTQRVLLFRVTWFVVLCSVASGSS